MLNYLPEIKKVLGIIVKETNELQSLNRKVDELLCDSLIKDSCLNKYKKTNEQMYFIYEVKEDDYTHITDHLNLLQSIISPSMVIMAQTNSTDSFRIIFRKA